MKQTVSSPRRLELPRNAAEWLEAIMNFLFFLCGILAVGCVVLISAYMILSGVPAIRQIGLVQFLFGKVWDPTNTTTGAQYGILPFILTSIYGTAGAMETSDGSVYKMAGKSGSGLLNGRKGTLILDKSGRVMTFLAAATGASRAVTLASASSTQIVDSKGVKYTVTAATETNYNGKAATWGEVYSWLAAGEALTLYLDESGRVTYVLVGGGVRTAEAAVIVSANGSTAGFDALAGGYTGYAIYKNGKCK